MTAPLHTFRPDWLRRSLAAAGAALVLALTVFAASPAAHEWLHAAGSGCSHAHGHDHGRGGGADDDAGCAVVLFASGVDLPVEPAAALPPRLVAQGVTPVTAAEPWLVSPRYLRQPERGPPGRA
jgi:hypothetical protein